MAKLSYEVLAHLEWLGFVQPTGLVVSAPALVCAGALIHQSDRAGQQLLTGLVEYRSVPGSSDATPCLRSFKEFATQVLSWSWSPKGYAGMDGTSVPDALRLHLPDYETTLCPDFAVVERDPANGRIPWQLFVNELDPGQDLDRPFKAEGQLEASPHSRLERLLRQTGVPAGLLFNGLVLRLVSAPYGESSGWIDFRVKDMVETAGRPICAALRLLLSEQRLLALGKDQRLAALLEESRKYQNTVSERLAEQVLHGLYELMRGLQAAHDSSKGELLKGVLETRPDDVYHALLNVVLRMVFLLYAEERGMLSKDEVFVRHYSIAGLYERLREDVAHHPDTMDQRYGAWAQLLALFRMVHDGAETGAVVLPKRNGVLFDPSRYPFLEGRISAVARQVGDRLEVPLIPDGTIYRTLEKLLVLGGERISYRALDVEQIGSVYETMMGFRIERATGTSVAIKAGKNHGAPTTIDLDALGQQPAAKREKWIRDRTERKLTKTVSGPVKEAESTEDLHHALDKLIDRRATPDLVPKGALVLQPSEARRKSGSHYTPRALTEPIVRTTFRPILERLWKVAGGPPQPKAILDLKVCDPAMGSGAFLVEACRQLADALIESWAAHDARPEIPHDEDEVIHARRMVAQRCLYGVDRNPVAVDLAKVSLWLATLARDHAFTFVDHALRHGDSLVGLSNEQIAARNWDGSEPLDSPRFKKLKDQVKLVGTLRLQIREADETVTDFELRDMWDEADQALSEVRTFGDLIVEAFFKGGNSRERVQHLTVASALIGQGDTTDERERLKILRQADTPLVPFHWKIEFSEVFERENPGFDAFVGNPPFAGHVSVATSNARGYTDWLRYLHAESAGKCDLVAHFFRRAFDLLRQGGTLGLIATNTIGQGDTRSTGLRWICEHEGVIYHATKRVKWPGLAAVVVSVLHVIRGEFLGRKRLDDREVETISAYLFHRGGHDDPTRLAANGGKSFQGSIVLGMGFTFDDTDKKGVATPLAEMRGLIEADLKNKEAILPYIGGEEVNTSPTHAHHRYVINFGDRSEKECRERWPDLIAIIEERVKPERVESARKSKSSHGRRAGVWWQHYHGAHDLHSAIAGMERVLVLCRHQPQWGVAFLPAASVFAESLIVFPLLTHAAFCALQSRPHELWARFFGSSMKDDLRYTPSDCFEAFPFPEAWQSHPALEAAGEAYYEFRATLMVQSDEGLTRTYNRFHDPDERSPEVHQLRELHAAMDQAVLIAYGWSDVATDCEFLLDYEDEEEDDSTTRKRKKPWRYRWPDDVRDEVLARLLELNAQRAAEERPRTEKQQSFA